MLSLIGIVSVECEAGLAMAAVQQTTARYLTTLSGRKQNERRILYIGDKPFDDIAENVGTNEKPSANSIAKYVDAARQTLLKVLKLNNRIGYNIRIEATVYLRIVELALMYGSTRHLARHYFENFLKIKEKTEHDFLHQWNLKLTEELKYIETNFIIESNSGNELDFATMKNDLNKHICLTAINRTAAQIEKEEVSEAGVKTKVLFARLKNVLTDEFGLSLSSTDGFIKNYKMIEELKKICPRARMMKIGT